MDVILLFFWGEGKVGGLDWIRVGGELGLGWMFSAAVSESIIEILGLPINSSIIFSMVGNSHKLI